MNENKINFCDVRFYCSMRANKWCKYHKWCSEYENPIRFCHWMLTESGMCGNKEAKIDAMLDELLNILLKNKTNFGRFSIPIITKEEKIEVIKKYLNEKQESEEK